MNAIHSAGLALLKGGMILEVYEQLKRLPDARFVPKSKFSGYIEGEIQNARLIIVHLADVSWLNGNIEYALKIYLDLIEKAKASKDPEPNVISMYMTNVACLHLRVGNIQETEQYFSAVAGTSPSRTRSLIT